MANKTTESPKTEAKTAKKAKLTELEVALHHHKTQKAKKVLPKLHPLRPAGFTLIIVGVILLCLSCIWWATSGRLVITTKEHYDQISVSSQYPSAVTACKFLRPSLINTYLGNESYLHSNVRWVPPRAPLSNGQLNYETCSYRLDKPDLEAKIEIFGFVDTLRVEAAWEKIKLEPGVKRLPLDAKNRESFMSDDNTMYLLQKQRIIVLRYGPALKTTTSFLTEQMVGDFMRDAVTSIDYFTDLRAH